MATTLFTYALDQVVATVSYRKSPLRFKQWFNRPHDDERDSFPTTLQPVDRRTWKERALDTVWSPLPSWTGCDWHRVWTPRCGPYERWKGWFCTTVLPTLYASLGPKTIPMPYSTCSSSNQRLAMVRDDIVQVSIVLSILFSLSPSDWVKQTRVRRIGARTMIRFAPCHTSDVVLSIQHTPNHEIDMVQCSYTRLNEHNKQITTRVTRHLWGYVWSLTQHHGVSLVLDDIGSATEMYASVQVWVPGGVAQTASISIREMDLVIWKWLCGCVSDDQLSAVVVGSRSVKFIQPNTNSNGILIGRTRYVFDHESCVVIPTVNLCVRSRQYVQHLLSEFVWIIDMHDMEDAHDRNIAYVTGWSSKRARLAMQHLVKLLQHSMARGHAAYHGNVASLAIQYVKYDLDIRCYSDQHYLTTRVLYDQSGRASANMYTLISEHPITHQTLLDMSGTRDDHSIITCDQEWFHTDGQGRLVVYKIALASSNDVGEGKMSETTIRQYVLVQMSLDKKSPIVPDMCGWKYRSPRIHSVTGMWKLNMAALRVCLRCHDAMAVFVHNDDVSDEADTCIHCARIHKLKVKRVAWLDDRVHAKVDVAVPLFRTVADCVYRTGHTMPVVVDFSLLSSNCNQPGYYYCLYPEVALHEFIDVRCIKSAHTAYASQVTHSSDLVTNSTVSEDLRDEKMDNKSMDTLKVPLGNVATGSMQDTPQEQNMWPLVLSSDHPDEVSHHNQKSQSVILENNIREWFGVQQPTPQQIQQQPASARHEGWDPVSDFVDLVGEHVESQEADTKMSSETISDPTRILAQISTRNFYTSMLAEKAT